MDSVWLTELHGSWPQKGAGELLQQQGGTESGGLSSARYIGSKLYQIWPVLCETAVLKADLMADILTISPPRRRNILSDRRFFHLCSAMWASSFKWAFLSIAHVRFSPKITRMSFELPLLGNSTNNLTLSLSVDSILFPWNEIRAFRERARLAVLGFRPPRSRTSIHSEFPHFQAEIRFMLQFLVKIANWGLRWP